MKEGIIWTRRRLAIVLVVFFVVLSLSTVVRSQTRPELCQRYSGTADPRIYQCCMAGIEDYDECIAYTGGGSGGYADRAQPTRVYRQPPAFKSGNGLRQFESQLGKNAYDSLLACRKAGRAECPEYSRILQAAFAKFDAYLETCRGNKRCIDRTPDYGIDDIMNAGTYARTDAPLVKTAPAKSTSGSKKPAVPEPAKPTTVQQTVTPAPNIPPSPATQTARNTNSNIRDRFYEIKKQAVKSSMGVTYDIDNNPLSGTQLTRGLGESLPYIKTEKSFPGLNKGQALGFTLKGSYIGEGLLTTSEDMEGGMLTIAAVDGRSTSRIGPSAGFDEDILDKVPRNLKVEQAYKLSVSGSRTDHFNEALFQWEVAHIPDKKYRAYAMMRFGPDGIWKPLPQVLDYCDTAKCSYISDPEGLGYYAIVQETHAEPLDESYLLAAIIIGIGAAIGITGFRHRMAQKKHCKETRK